MSSPKMGWRLLRWLRGITLAKSAIFTFLGGKLTFLLLHKLLLFLKQLKLLWRKVGKISFLKLMSKTWTTLGRPWWVGLLMVLLRILRYVVNLFIIFLLCSTIANKKLVHSIYQWVFPSNVVGFVSPNLLPRFIVFLLDKECGHETTSWLLYVF